MNSATGPFARHLSGISPHKNTVEILTPENNVGTMPVNYIFMDDLRG